MCSMLVLGPVRRTCATSPGTIKVRISYPTIEGWAILIVGTHASCRVIEDRRLPLEWIEGFD